jgi:hypothetical protein
MVEGKGRKEKKKRFCSEREKVRRRKKIVLLRVGR